MYGYERTQKNAYQQCVVHRSRTLRSKVRYVDYCRSLYSYRGEITFELFLIAYILIYYEMNCVIYI